METPIDEAAAKTRNAGGVPLAMYVELRPSGAGPVAIAQPGNQVVVGPSLVLVGPCPGEGCGAEHAMSHGAVILAILQHRLPGHATCNDCGQKILPRVPLLMHPTGAAPKAYGPGAKGVIV